MANVDLPDLVSKLTLEEKISLLAGRDFWNTVPIPRLNIPSLRVSDGPNGARGAAFEGGTTAACFPASVCLAASWDHDLAREIGAALAAETRSKGACVLLGPTVCPHRGPLGGRNFESFSEDPLLAGEMAANYIAGLQAQGVGATIKHFAANEQETKRFTMNVNVSERALREIYLKPFEIAIKHGEPWAVMTSYNLVNGTHSDMNEFLLQKVLREEWGFSGLVMSDWGGTNSTAQSITAGLDLEMPGPTIRRKIADVQAAIQDGSLEEASVNKAVLAILELVKKGGKFARPGEVPEEAIIRPEDGALIRKAGAQGAVLLKNDGILPLDTTKMKSVALVGMAKECLAHGGGSASVNCHYEITPYDALKEQVDDNGVELKYAPGVQTIRNLPVFEKEVVDKAGKPGWTVESFRVRSTAGTPDSITTQPTAKCLSMGGTPCKAQRVTGTFRPTVSGSHYISFASLGPSSATINGEEIFSIKDSASDVMGFLVGAAVEQQKQYLFEAGKDYNIVIETLSPEAKGDEFPMFKDLLAVRLGFLHQAEMEADLLTTAIEAARSSDVAIVFVGHTPAWETEGIDQASMNLPIHGSQDKLIAAVAAVNSNTIVVNSTGVAIAMPWLADVKAVLQAWFAGQEAGNSIVDVLTGRVNPSGRLPITIPRSIEDTPCFENFPGDIQTLQVRYEEDIYIGYRFYDQHPEKILFPFGFGLSYSAFEISGLHVAQKTLSQGYPFKFSVDVSNTGKRDGSHVVQVYIAPPHTTNRALKTLAAFKKLEISAGEKETANLEISHEHLGYWDESMGLWKVDRGMYELQIGSSSRDIEVVTEFEVQEDFTYMP